MFSQTVLAEQLDGYKRSLIFVATASVSNIKDTIPPSAPEDLTVIQKTFTSITLSWTKSGDNVGVKGYQLFKDGKKIITTSKTSFTNSDLIPGRKYIYSVKAYDAIGNLSEASTVLEVTTIIDDQVPSPPETLSITKTDFTSINVTWGASIDNSSIRGYEIYRNGKKVAATSATSYIVKGLMPGTIYTFFVKAYDIAGNYSFQSNSISGATTPDKIAPNLPTGLKVSTISETDITLTWSPSSDNVKVKSYDVFCNGDKVGTTTKTYYYKKDLIPGKNYIFIVRAADVSGNKSGSSEPLKIMTPKDLQRPSAPTGLKVISISGKSVSLEWKASTDNIKVKGYFVYCNGIQVASTSKTARTVKSSIDLGIDVFWVVAYDLADNLSDKSNALTVIVS